MRGAALVALTGIALEMAVAAPAFPFAGLSGGGGGGGAGAGSKGGAGAGAGIGAARAGGGGRRNKKAPTTQQITTARDTWQADTGIVSDFLSTASFMDAPTMQQAAQGALRAELDETRHKAVLDRAFNSGGRGDSATVGRADAVLEDQGTFQRVVDGLRRMAASGAAMTPRRVAAEVSTMNDVRCGAVLPSIDAYLDAASGAAQDGAAARAIRPTNCPGGAQGMGAMAAQGASRGSARENGQPNQADGDGTGDRASAGGGSRGNSQDDGGSDARSRDRGNGDARSNNQASSQNSNRGNTPTNSQSSSENRNQDDGITPPNQASSQSSNRGNTQNGNSSSTQTRNQDSRGSQPSAQANSQKGSRGSTQTDNT